MKTDTVVVTTPLVADEHSALLTGWHLQSYIVVLAKIVLFLLGCAATIAFVAGWCIFIGGCV
jgi:hypothetical protein